MWRSGRRAFTPLTSLVGIGLAASLGIVSFSFAHNSPAEGGIKPKDVKFKVAIIGSGIGGSSAAHFIRKSLNTSVEIDVFEKAGKVGGRMAVIEIDKEEYEAGGAVIHDSNKYMAEFCSILGLEKLRDTDERIGIYDGKEFVFLSTGYSLLDKMKLFLRYGFDLLKMNKFTTSTMKNFDNVYKVQNDGKSFETVPDLLRSLGGEEFVEMTQQSARDVLEKKGISKKLIDELATAISRCNYGQDMGLNAFTGFVSLAGAQSGKLWAVRGGNYKVCEGILEKSGVKLTLNSKVNGISKGFNEKQQMKYGLDVNGKTTDFIYDVVVVAVPLEVKSSFVQCNACSKWPKPDELGHYQQTVATFVKGTCNYTAFGLAKPSDSPDTIFTVENPELFFSSMGKLNTVENKKSDSAGNVPVYKVFSREVLSKEQLNSLFKSTEGKVGVVNWLAYPHYTPPEKFTPFKLDNGIFYVNAIERAASAMEMSAIGGRNSALLAVKYLETPRKEDDNSLNLKVKREF